MFTPGSDSGGRAAGERSGMWGWLLFALLVLAAIAFIVFTIDSIAVG